MVFDEISAIDPSWIASDDIYSDDRSVAIMTCSTLRRNIAGYPFTVTCDRSRLLDTAAQLLSAAGRSDRWTPCDFRMIDSMDAISRKILVESRVITQSFAAGGAGRFILRDEAGSVSCTINDDDHICVSACRPNLAVRETLDQAAAVIDLEDVEMSRDPILGYLTSDPRYVGTGLKIYVMLHLAGLDASGEMGRTIASFERDFKKVSIHKLSGENSNAVGSFYLLSNIVTLGVTCDDIAELIADAAESMISKELFARHKITHSKNFDMSDRCWRAWGLLRYARKLSFSEAASRVSFVKLASDIGILPKIDERDWRRLILNSQSAHISLMNNRPVDRSEEPFIRASMYRQFVERSGVVPPKTISFRTDL